MLLLCGGNIRSGSTLQFNLAREIVGHALHANQSPLWLHAHNAIDKSHWVAVKSHWYPSPWRQGAHHINISDDNFADGKVKVLMTYRDLRDVAVSLMRFQGISFGELISSGTLSRMVIVDEPEWFKNVPTEYIFRRKYEDWTENLYDEVIDIANFLAVTIEAKEMARIISEYNAQHVSNSLAHSNNMNAITYFSPNHISDSPYNYRGVLTDKEITTIENQNGVSEWLTRNGYKLHGNT